MSEISLEEDIRNIIENTGLDTCTMGSIVESLRQTHGSVIESRITEIKHLVDTILVSKITEFEGLGQEKQEESFATQESDEILARKLQAEARRTGLRNTNSSTAASRKRKSSTDDSVAKKNNPFNKPLVLSSVLEALVHDSKIDERLSTGQATMSRPQVVKRIWAYVREHNLQDPLNRRFFNCDIKMEAVFKKKRVECFAMNKILSAHLSSPGDTILSISPTDVSKNSTSIKKPSSDVFPHERKKISSPKSSLETKIMIPACFYSIIPYYNSKTNKTSIKSIQKACISYILEHNLVDRQDISVIIPSNNPLSSIMGISETKTISIVDFLDKIREICLEENEYYEE